MAEAEFLFDEFTQFAEKFGEVLTKKLEKKEKAMLRKSGSKLLRKTKAQARKVGKKTGKYQSSIKRGKVYRKDGALAIRVYSGAPHGHLIEEGHNQTVNPGKGRGNGHGVIPGKGIGHKPQPGKKAFVEGQWVFDKTLKAFVPIFQADVEDMLDEVMREL